MATNASSHFTRAQVSAALNRAADDIALAADLPDAGAKDALNLLVNAGLTYLDNPEASLDDAIAANYGVQTIDAWLRMVNP